jgi:NAD(P)-dependent dehydrogenase (short-subunit alcohol dehydrogenase family)
VTLRQAVVVTGASSGIGAATATLLARRGYAVFAGVRTDRDALRLSGDDNIHPLRLDVTDAASLQSAADEVARGRRSIAALVNNAGIAVAGPLEFLPVDALRRQFEVNLFGAVAATQAFLPLLRRGRGRLVFVGSVSGILPRPYIAPYSASKAALRAIASALRTELAASGIATVLVEPGSTRTPIWRKGRDAADGIRRSIGPEGVHHYGRILDTMVAITERQERLGMPADRVAQAIVRAIEARRAPAEVLVGFGARMGSMLALLPAPWRDRIIASPLRARP